MKFLIAERISANKYKTPEGYLVCVDSVLARTGKQTYRKDEIFDCDDSSEISVDRRPEEVFSEATLASFENKPLTIEHPDEDVNTSNFRDLAVGFVRDIHRGKDNGQDVMLGTLVITDEQAIEDVESGKYRELSCGYDCDIDDINDPQQKNIRGNHIALCENGRAGIARIVDSINDEDDNDIEYRVHFVNSADRQATFTTYAKNENSAKVNAKSKLGREIYRIIRVEAIRHKYEVTLRYDDKKSHEIYKPEIVQAYSRAEAIKIAKENKHDDYGLDVKSIRKLDSEDNMMKDKLIDIPSDVMNKIDSQFKSKAIRISKKGKTFSGRIHYQIEFNGKVKDLVKKLEEIESFADRLNIPMTFAANANKDDTFATAGVDFDKQHVDDSDVEDGKNAAENAVEAAMSELNIDISKLRENKDKVIMKISSKGLYGRTQAGWFVDDYIKNHVNDAVHDEDLITKAINDEVTAIELYNQILAGNVDDETRAIIEEIRDDENDHLVKLTKLKNNISSNDEDIEDEDEEIVEDEELLHDASISFTTAATGRNADQYIKENRLNCKVVKHNVSGWGPGSQHYYDIEGSKEDIIKLLKLMKKYSQFGSKIKDLNEEIVNDEATYSYSFPRFTSQDKIASAKYKLKIVYNSGSETEVHGTLSNIQKFAKEYLGYQLHNSYLEKISDSEEIMEDAAMTFEIRWIDTYKKSKGYSKEEYLHIDKIKAEKLSEALKKLADDVALAGIGTMNAMIVSIRSDKATYMYSGKLGELVRKVKDSSKIQKAIDAIKAIHKTK